MANYIVSLIVQRLILPILLSTCCLLRPVAISLPYLLFLFYLPFIPVANYRSIKGHTGIYLALLISVSVLLCLAQIGFQIFLAVVGNDVIAKCEFLEILLRHVGFVRLDNLDVLSIIQWLAPEVIAFFGSIIVTIILRRSSAVNVQALDTDTNNEGTSNNQSPPTQQLPDVHEIGLEKWRILVKAGKILSLLSLCATGALQPSALSVIYYLVFLGSATWWAMNKQLERAFAIVLRIVIVFMMLHIIAFLGYQNPWPQEFLEPNTTLPRVLGFPAIYTSSCDNATDIRIINFNEDLDLDHYLNPIALIICYLVVTLTSIILLEPQGYVRKECPELTRDTEPNERTPLMRSGTRKVADSKPDAPIRKDSDTIPMSEIGNKMTITEKDENEEDEQSTGFCEQIAIAASSIAEFIYKNSYIFTNVVMMAWSIIYHSWLGFVLLIWANLIWIIPNQRKNMLRSSPFLVAYAEFLLLATYLYGMNLTDDELPANVKVSGINLPQIGFIKYPHFPIGPIMLKSLFTVMFLSSLRQMVQEKQAERQTTALADMVAPLQLTVGAATAREGIQKKAEKESAFITKAAKFINAFLIKFWIIVVSITLFVCGISGQEMTGFRIVYMTLFLIFVLTFQFSFSVWRKFMYGFWLLVILYSMIILILVYTYQFDKTSEYFEKYLHISKTLQRDIGLERYDAKQLFLHLVTPTMIVIITVIQLHYCHTKFLEFSEIPESPADNISKTSSVAYGTFAVSRSDDDDDNDTTDENLDILNEIKIRKLSRQEIEGAAKRLFGKLLIYLDIILLFLEIHFYKIMLLCAFLLAVRGVELLHISFVILGVAGLRAKTESQFLVTRIAAVVSSILLISTMIYQVDYISHNNYESNCTNASDPTKEVTNNAVWIGFRKETKEIKLADLIRPYLAYIILVSIHSFMILFQTIRRIRQHKPARTPTVVFKHIRRVDADRDIPHLIKYLINYGFYKFGVEICLIGYLMVIGYRMDIVACFYAIWLCFLYKLDRNEAKKIWSYATYFLIASIPIQYISLVGLPPGLCIDYPWKNVDFLKDFNIFAFLPDSSLEFKDRAKLLLLDFILLLMMCRQLIVFRIEARYDNSVVNFPGGSNKSILQDIDQLGVVPFDNPTHDFIDKIRNYLDILKRFIFIIFFWATLAIVFLTGTSRVNLLSLGYIIGSFIFLWQGTDFYLRPIYVILRWWNYLIAYNVSVVAIKTLIQLVGCLVLRLSLTDSGCTFIQLFGVTCICRTKYSSGDSQDDPQLPDNCKVPLEDGGLFWDGVCFAFLILQRRMFSSHYFCHVINEAKASLILASRGNELIEELRKKEMSQEAEREAQILQKIKMKMDRIKATQQRVLEENEPKTHAAAIRSGDYYMFEDVEDEFELDIINQRDSDDEEEKKSATRRRLSKKMNFSQYLNKMKEDTEKERIEQLEQEELEKKKIMARRSSSPVLRHTSQQPDTIERSAHSEPIPRTHFEPISSFDDETEGLIQADGARPSTSRGFRDDEDTSLADERSKLIKDKDGGKDEGEDGEKKETEAERKRKLIIKKLKMIPDFLSSVLVSITLRLHRVSRSYRYVMRVLAREKKTLKHSPGFGAGFRSGTNMIWTPIQHAKTSRRSPAESGDSAETAPVQDIIISRDSDSLSSSNCIAQADSLKMTLDDRTDRDSMISSVARLSGSEGLHPMGGIGAAFALMQRDRDRAAPPPPPPPSEEVRRSSWIAPEIRILAPSLDHGIDNEDSDSFRCDSLISVQSKTKDVVVKIEDEPEEDDFASKEHNIFVELFQALWYVVLSHTDFICYAMVFLNQIKSASILSLPLPFMVLLWGTLTFPRPSKTFWVTLIAYTQAVVLIKCAFQFDIFSWNTAAIPPNQPFAAARILGIEKKNGYATYDLILLLVVFCHRIILKSLGLWKSEVTTDKLIPGEKYQVEAVNKEIEKESNEIVLLKNNDKKKPDENGKSVTMIDNRDTVMVEESDDEATGFVVMFKLSCQKYISSIKEFINQLFDRQSKRSADVYGFLFLCDFINFFVILFGFSAFGTQEGDGGVLSYFEENKVPITFLLMLIIQFFFIVIDRALYLRKNMFGKIIFQFFLIIGLHIWMFFVLPATTERSFNKSRPPVIYYMIKCFYLLFSAYQIRCGYPSRILGNFLTKGFTMLNFAGFKVFMNIPFLMELRTLMDWVWTDTSMTLFDWLKMEDIFANIYQLKCSRQMESDLPAPRGQKKGPVVKYLMGGGMIIGIITVIWFPLALFAFSNTVGEPNRPEDVSVSLRIGPYEPVYAMSAQGADIFELKQNDWDYFLKRYSKDKSAITFLSNYEPSDVAAVKLGSNSSTIWNISPPDKERLLKDLYENKTLTTRFKYNVKRKSHSKENPGAVDDEHTYDFKGNDTIGMQLRKMLEDTKTPLSTVVPFMMPKFLKVKNNGLLRPAHQLIKGADSDDDEINFRNLTLKLYEEQLGDVVLAMPQLWWEVTESCDEFYYKDTSGNNLYADCKKYMMMYMFCDKIFPSTISSIAAGGIVGLYTTLIFVFSRMLRSTIFSGASSKIMFEDLPYVDRVLQLCLDIYLVRESLEFTLEEDLFAKLIFLYRSPETMIKWTRPKKERNEDDTDSLSTDQVSMRKKTD
ncbi:piezo-type mechanosensitive ion channel component isoform X4 [Chironomus tepperi]|uniref:piezo-type mechanosensitive ion channel component isoform X4 n=1 Tax=Chironomus tepperi TaxID=113505 RepID=UPI00391F9F01